MPLVFVHGVNVRRDSAYGDYVAVRGAYFRTFMFPAATIRPHIAEPYWGEYGVKFRWDLASLPSGRYETLGAVQRIQDLRDEIAPDPDPNDRDVLLPLARRSLIAAVDLLWAATACALKQAGFADDLAVAAKRACDYADWCPAPSWLADVRNDEEFVARLLVAINAGESVGEALGASRIASALKRGLGALARAPAAATVAAVRPLLNAKVTRFFGDVMQYLDARGVRGDEGPIVHVVADALRDADAARADGDDLLIVLAHSMGGNIVYDILTAFEPSISCDFLITVGSQVALFEEMKKFHASDPGIPDCARPHVRRPRNVRRWINVFDPVDILAYAAKPVFDDVEDFTFVSSTSPFHAHGNYFLRPEFYQRLSARLGSHTT